MKKIITICTLIVSQLNNAQELKNDTGIDKLLETKIKEAKIPGMAAAIIYKDSIFYGVSGTISNKSEQKITNKTLFHFASNTKAFTSFLAFQSIEKGKITINTKFFEVFPELKNEKNSNYHSITLGDLLAHNAQVQPFTAGIEINQIKITKKNVSEKRIEFANQLLQMPIVEKGTYSNAGYVLISMMLEKVEEKSFEELLANYLESQKWSYCFGFPNKKDINNAWGHWTEFFTFKALPPDHAYGLPDYMLAAGDLSMNMEDYSQWLHQHIQGLQNKDANNPYQIMHYQQEDMSYGWANAVQNDQKISYHDGSTGTFYTHALLLPEQQIGVTIFANAADEKHVKAIYQLQQELFVHLKKIIDANNSKP